MNRLIVCLFGMFIFFSLSCTSSCKQVAEEPPSEKSLAIAQVRKKTVEILSERHNIDLASFGCKAFDKIKDFSLGFYVYRPLTRDQARIIIIDCINEIVQQVSQCEAIQPFLYNSGLDYTQVGVNLIVYLDVEEVVHPDLGGVYTAKGDLVYVTNDPEGSYKYKSEIKEKYSDALAIVKEQEQQKIALYENPETEKSITIRNFLDEVGKKFESKYGLYSIPHDEMRYENMNEICMVFKSDKMFSKDEARELLLECNQEIISQATNSEKLKSYMSAEGLSEKNIHIFLNMKQDGQKVYHPHLGSATSQWGYLFFATCDPKNPEKCKTQLIEKFNEALEIAKVK